MTAALAALLALVIHQLAYLLAYPVAATRTDQLADHGHLSTQWALVTPVAVLAAAGFIIRQIRQLGLGRSLDARWLGVLGGSAFFVQEFIEAGLGPDGFGAVATNPAVWIGLAVTPLVAYGLERILHQATELVARLLDGPPPVDIIRAATLPRPGDDPRLSGIQLAAVPARGPPRSLRS